MTFIGIQIKKTYQSTKVWYEALEGKCGLRQI
jgi:hypothetical protein